MPNRGALLDLASAGELLLEVGLLPVSHRFLDSASGLEAPAFPLQLRIDPETGLIHQGKPFPVEALKPCYDWLSRFEPEDHLDLLAETLIHLPGLSSASVFGGVTFKDDSTLRRLERLGFDRQWRLDPDQDLGVSDPCASVETYQAALTPVRAAAIRERTGGADVLIVRHLLEHAQDLPSFIQALRALVRPGGYLVLEVPDCARSLEAGDCTLVWEEHTYYFTPFTLRQTLLAAGFSIHFEVAMPYPLENSLIAIVQESESPFTPPGPLAVGEEIARARAFATSLGPRGTAVRSRLEALRQQHGAIALLGAGHLASAFLSILQVADLIQCVLDDDPHKQGLRMPLNRLPIRGSEALYEGDLKVCLLGVNPQNQPKVREKHARFLQQGGVFASLFPGTEGYLEDLA